MDSLGPLVELRRYRTHHGRREDLVRVFDAHFVEGQEVCGAQVHGQFRDLDDPDSFVWIRAFASREVRRRALRDFYGGPVWAAHREVANAAMTAFDDVLLLTGVLVVPDAVRGRVEVVIGPDPLPGALVALPTVPADVAAEVGADFPALPVRTDVDAIVSVFHGTAPAGPHRLRLEPTPRSHLR